VFRNSGQTYDGIPIMASNMDTIGTFEMAKMLSKVCQVITELLHTHTLPFKKIFSLCYNSGVAIN